MATARIEARTNQDTKDLIQKAADLEGQTLSAFLLESVQEAAYKVIERHQTLKLTIRDSEAFADAILNPPQPNEALRAAAERYKQVITD
jgi:uncharacterized protein (DUF1778 family)